MELFKKKTTKELVKGRGTDGGETVQKASIFGKVPPFYPLLGGTLWQR